MAERQLPLRTTRGKRLHTAEDDEAGADEEFWNQEFFKEEAADDDYESEKEEADHIDSDFDLTVRSSVGGLCGDEQVSP